MISIDELGTVISAASLQSPLLNMCQKVLLSLKTFCQFRAQCPGLSEAEWIQSVRVESLECWLLLVVFRRWREVLHSFFL